MSQSPAVDAVAALERAGAELAIENGNIRVRYPLRSALGPSIKAAVALLKQNKDEAIAYLAQRPADSVSGLPTFHAVTVQLERKPAHPLARLYPFLERRVRTPQGTGRLVQVFSDRAAVVLDRELVKPESEQKITFFPPADICPPEMI
jgi:hypothetical protein